MPGLKRFYQTGGLIALFCIMFVAGMLYLIIKGTTPIPGNPPCPSGRLVEHKLLGEAMIKYGNEYDHSGCTILLKNGKTIWVKLEEFE